MSDIKSYIRTLVKDRPYDLICEFHDFLFLQRLTAPDIDTATQERAKEILDTFIPLFARQIFDYSFVACLGEARHSWDRCYEAFIGYFDTGAARESVYQYSYQYDPTHCLPTLIDLFEMEWESSYGGDLWAAIARKAYEFWKGEISDLLYIDAVVWLNHNGGLYLDKPFIFRLESANYLRWLLDFKRHNDLLNDFSEIVESTDYCLTYFLLSTPVYDLLEKYVNPDLLRAVMKSKNKSIVTLGYSPIEYGNMTISLVYKNYRSEEEEESSGELILVPDQRVKA